MRKARCIRTTVDGLRCAVRTSNPDGDCGRHPAPLPPPAPPPPAPGSLTPDSSVSELKRALEAALNPVLEGCKWSVQRLGVRSVAVEWCDGPARSEIGGLVAPLFTGASLSDGGVTIRTGVSHEQPTVIIVRSCSPTVRVAALLDWADTCPPPANGPVDGWAEQAAREVDEMLAEVPNPELLFGGDPRAGELLAVCGQPRGGGDRAWLARVAAAAASRIVSR